MSGQVRRSLALALVGLLGGLGLVAALFGGESLRQLTGRPAQPDSETRALADPGALASRQDPSADPSKDPRGDRPGQAGAPPGAAGSGKPATSDTPPAGTAAVPRFDIVRVEPNGDAVVAGQGAPHAVVEMLVNGKPVARAKADAAGQFAVVPPALQAGSSQIRLRMTGPDGRAAESEQSVAVEVAPGRDRQPLVALTAPDAATVVLSQPGAPGAQAAAAAPAGAPGTPATPGTGPSTRIASVDVQENGRLFVTATGVPGAMLRLYLNDTLIAPGRIGPDGRASFTIGRGMRPGQYQVRIDQIDPATGKVETRAEVPLAVPEPAGMAAREPAESHPAPARGHAQTNAQMNAPSNTQVGARAGGRAGGPGGATGSAGGGVTANATGGARATPDRAEVPTPRGPARPPQAQASATPDSRPMAAEAGADATVGAVYVPEINTAKITRGDNLWRISQRTYGRGNRYTVIYDANQTQIRNPDLIYPGQIFVLPEDKRG